MREGPRELPNWKETMLSAVVVRLNKLPVEELLRLFHERKILIFVDRGMAIQAASSGVPTSGLTLLFSLLFPVLLLSVPALWYFFSWLEAIGGLLLALFAFRTSRAGVVSNVRNQALKHPKLLNLLISNGTIWFERHQPALLSDTEIDRLSRASVGSDFPHDGGLRGNTLGAVHKPAAASTSEVDRQQKPNPQKNSANTSGGKMSADPTEISEIEESDKTQSKRETAEFRKAACRVSEASEGILELLLKDEDREEDEDADFDRWDSQEREIGRIPEGSVEVANFEDEIDHSPGLTWIIDITLYVVPISKEQKTYALLVLRWDDNWGTWEWEAHYIAKGASSVEEAKQALLSRYVDEHTADAEDEYREFLEDLVEDVGPTHLFRLPPDHNGFHDVMDCVVTKFKEPMQRIFPNEAENFVEVKCELVSYAAAYKAKLDTGSEINRMIWNTLVASIENRIFSHLGARPNLSGYEEGADGSRTFISYASIYSTHMQELDGIIKQQVPMEKTNILSILDLFSVRESQVDEGAMKDLRILFESASKLYAETLIHHLLEDF